MLWRLIDAFEIETQSPNLQETVKQDAVKAVFPYGQVHLEVGRIRTLSPKAASPVLMLHSRAGCGRRSVLSEWRCHPGAG